MAKILNDRNGDFVALMKVWWLNYYFFGLSGAFARKVLQENLSSWQNFHVDFIFVLSMVRIPTKLLDLISNIFFFNYTRAMAAANIEFKWNINIYIVIRSRSDVRKRFSSCTPRPIAQDFMFSSFPFRGISTNQPRLLSRDYFLFCSKNRFFFSALLGACVYEIKS